jgi:hypothetical protein
VRIIFELLLQILDAMSSSAVPSSVVRDDFFVPVGMFEVCKPNKTIRSSLECTEDRWFHPEGKEALGSFVFEFSFSSRLFMSI